MALGLNNIVVDSEGTFGAEKLVVGVRASNLFVNNQKTDTIDAWNYETLLPKAGFEKVSVKIKQPVIAPFLKDFQAGQSIPVEFKNLTVKIFQDYKTKGIRVAASADDILPAPKRG
jgi:hypothetical protein